MNSDANTAAHLSIDAYVNAQQKLFGFVELFTSIWWMIFVAMLVINIVE